MTCATRRILLTAAALACSALVACSSPPSHYYGRSLATNSPQQSQRVNQMHTQTGSAGHLPWYAARNDAVPTTYAGYESATVEYVGTYTRDHQHTHGNNVRDDYHRRTYSTTVRQVVR